MTLKSYRREYYFPFHCETVYRWIIEEISCTIKTIFLSVLFDAFLAIRNNRKRGRIKKTELLKSKSQKLRCWRSWLHMYICVYIVSETFITPYFLSLSNISSRVYKRTTHITYLMISWCFVDNKRCLIVELVLCVSNDANISCANLTEKGVHIFRENVSFSF